MFAMHQMQNSFARIARGKPLIAIIRRNITSKQLTYESYGNPLEVIKVKSREVSKPSPDQVRVRWLGAPVNPADINQLQGKYALKLSLPAVGGMEGFGEIEQVGSNVKTLQIGDWVVPSQKAMGCWQQYGVYSVNHLHKIDNQLSFESAATFHINPPTAYCMLKKFVDLKAGDLVVQNGGNSAVGQLVIQLCKAWGLRSVSVVRKRDNLNDLIISLKLLGADEVFTEEEMKKESRDRASDAQLALNCVGGKNAMYLANCLAPKGVMVTYGGMSNKHTEVPAGALIFKDIKVVGFWISQWYTTPGIEKERGQVYATLAKLMRNGKLSPPKSQKHKLEDWKVAIENTMNSRGGKQLFTMH